MCQKVITDYIPADLLDKSGITTLVGNQLNSDAYTSFLATDLKKAIDAAFKTLSGSENTYIMGSSMGGLASFYALCEYPEVFGGAACISTHWIGNFDFNSTIFPEAALEYLNDNLPSADTHKLYFDHGTEGLESAYISWNKKALEIASSKGYNMESGNLLSYIADGADHNEKHWGERVNIPLQFMLDNGNHPYLPLLPEEKSFHVVFCDPDVKWNTVYAFTWANGKPQTGEWPGTAMSPTTYKGKPAWEINFNHTTEPTNIIFNDIKASGITQTADLDFVNNSVYDFSGIIGSLSLSAPVYSDEELSIRLIGGNLHIRSDRKRSIPMVSLNGAVRIIELIDGENIISNLPEGLFLVNGKKLYGK